MKSNINSQKKKKIAGNTNNDDFYKKNSCLYINLKTKMANHMTYERIGMCLAIVYLILRFKQIQNQPDVNNHISWIKPITIFCLLTPTSEVKNL